MTDPVTGTDRAPAFEHQGYFSPHWARFEPLQTECMYHITRTLQNRELGLAPLPLSANATVNV